MKGSDNDDEELTCVQSHMNLTVTQIPIEIYKTIFIALKNKLEIPETRVEILHDFIHITFFFEIIIYGSGDIQFSKLP